MLHVGVCPVGIGRDLLQVPGQPPRRSATVKNTLSPTWDEKYEFECVLEMVVSSALSIEVYDEDFGVSTLLNRACNSSKSNRNARQLAQVRREVGLDSLPKHGVRS